MIARIDLLLHFVAAFIVAIRMAGEALPLHLSRPLCLRVGSLCFLFLLQPEVLLLRLVASTATFRCGLHCVVIDQDTAGPLTTSCLNRVSSRDRGPRLCGARATKTDGKTKNRPRRQQAGFDGRCDSRTARTTQAAFSNPPTGELPGSSDTTADSEHFLVSGLSTIEHVSAPTGAAAGNLTTGCQ